MASSSSCSNALPIVSGFAEFRGYTIMTTEMNYIGWGLWTSSLGSSNCFCFVSTFWHCTLVHFHPPFSTSNNTSHADCRWCSLRTSPMTGSTRLLSNTPRLEIFKWREMLFRHMLSVLNFAMIPELPPRPLSSVGAYLGPL
jgi:hypothetical protein